MLRSAFWSLLIIAAAITCNAVAMGDEPGGEKDSFALLEYLSADPSPRMIAYTPLGLDPRVASNNEAHKTSEFRKDLAALRPAFDGLILYGYHPASTPRILAIAKELKFRAVIVGIWQPKSVAEVDGAAALVNQFHDDLAMGVLVGNEGVIFNRYETDDVRFAAARLRKQIPATVAVSTSEPLVGYQQEFFQTFGDFLAPNIHPVFDRKDLGPAAAAEWAREQATALAKKAGKPVVLKETGFPHAGRDGFTPQSQASFWRSYTEPGLLTKPKSGSPWVYFGVAFEAYDLPWKSEASGLPIEKSWGMLSTERKPYPAFEVWQKLGK